MTEVGHVIDQSMRLDEINTVMSFCSIFFNEELSAKKKLLPQIISDHI